MVLAFIFNLLAYICVRKSPSKAETHYSNQLGLNMTQKINLCREYERVFFANLVSLDRDFWQ